MFFFFLTTTPQSYLCYPVYRGGGPGRAPVYRPDLVPRFCYVIFLNSFFTKYLFFKKLLFQDWELCTLFCCSYTINARGRVTLKKWTQFPVLNCFAISNKKYLFFIFYNKNNKNYCIF